MRNLAHFSLATFLSAPSRILDRKRLVGSLVADATTSLLWLAPADSALVSVPSTSLPPEFSIAELVFSPETILGHMNSETPDWLGTVVWTDFRLAVVFFVISPLILLAWSAIACRPQARNVNEATDAVLRIIAGYWQASALLLITVLLNMEASPIGVVTGAVAQAMIYISLNWWDSLNQQAASGKEPLNQVFAVWRAIASGVAGLGVVVQLPFLRCAATPQGLTSDPHCAAWLEPPTTVASLLNISPEMVNTLAMATFFIYVGYLVYYVCVPLQEIGRDGRKSRSSFTFIDPLIALGFLRNE